MDVGRDIDAIHLSLIIDLSIIIKLSNESTEFSLQCTLFCGERANDRVNRFFFLFFFGLLTYNISVGLFVKAAR